MKISLMSSEQLSPEWFSVSSEKLGNTDKKASPRSEDSMVFKVASGELTDTDVVAERERIEECSNKKTAYCANSGWGLKTKSSLREYARVFGVEYKEVTASVVSVEKEGMGSVASTSDRLIKSANVERHDPILDGLKSVMSDPFKLDQVSDAQEVEVWEKITPQQKLSSRPTMMTNNVISIGGGEDYNISPERRLPSNQNSITDPNAIERLAESDAMDTGEYIREQAENRKKDIVQSHKDWESSKFEELADIMSKSNMYSRGSVFLTESMDVQSGLNSPSSQMGVYAKFSKDDIPDKTEGEELRSRSEERRIAIQRESKESHEFEYSAAPSFSISDSLTESLKRELGKVENK